MGMSGVASRSSLHRSLQYFFFFFQAEDGIRDLTVTGVQTCALPISLQPLAAGEEVSGCSVHYVDQKIDHGEIIAQREVAILPEDTPESLHARIQIAERELYPAVIAEFCERYQAAGS